MARTVPNCPPRPSVEAVWAKKRTSREYHIQVITPLFGGGPTPGQNDPVTLIRGASIRGQLRFWWRATRGASYSSVDLLRKREAEIWGDTETPSQVQVMVKVNRPGRALRWAEYERRPDGSYKSVPKPVDGNFPSYALFPFQGKVNHGQLEKEPASVTQGTEFTLTLRWLADKALEKDVEAAVWAWVNFGGLGARTRRGCGSLYCRELAPTSAELKNQHALSQWITAKFREYGVALSSEPRQWPTLSDVAYYAPQADAPLCAWFMAVDLLRKFRQEVGIGRNPRQDGGRPGRSRWPEADSLRRITGQAQLRHRNPITTLENAFPRAEFGLPVVFHFQNPPGVSPTDPVDCTLKPAGGQDRMASPLIIKALALRADNGAIAVPLILRLNVKSVSAAVVTFKRGRADEAYEVAEDQIRRPELTTYTNSPMRGRSTRGSAIEGFLRFAEQNGFVR